MQSLAAARACSWRSLPCRAPQYIATLRRCKMRERLRSARRAMHARFPFSEALWLEWLDDDLPGGRGPDARAQAEALLDTAVQDYLSVPVWARYLRCVRSSPRAPPPCVRAACGAPAAALCRAAGRTRRRRARCPVACPLYLLRPRGPRSPGRQGSPGLGARAAGRAPEGASPRRFLQDSDPDVRARTDAGLAKFRAVAERALTAAGLHLPAGAQLWTAYRRSLLSRLPLLPLSLPARASALYTHAARPSRACARINQREGECDEARLLWERCRRSATAYMSLTCPAACHTAGTCG